MYRHKKAVGHTVIFGRQQTLPFDEIEEFLAPQIEEAQRIWRLCQEEAKKYNATLPDGKLLMVYDYD